MATEITQETLPIDDVIQANLLSITSTDEKAINTVYNVAYE